MYSIPPNDAEKNLFSKLCHAVGGLMLGTRISKLGGTTGLHTSVRYIQAISRGAASLRSPGQIFFSFQSTFVHRFLSVTCSRNPTKFSTPLIVP